jgi:uncharacterized delta-60 repeat protein
MSSGSGWTTYRKPVIPLVAAACLVCAAWRVPPGDAAMHDVAHAVARYNVDGTPDQTFNSSGLVAIRTQDQAFANAVTIQPDGKIVVVGAISQVSTGLVALEVLRYNADGSPDTAFGSGGAAATRVDGMDAEANAVALQPDGKILVAGTAHSTGGDRDRFMVARFTSDGSLDTTFGTAGTASTPVGQGSAAGHGLALQSDGKVVVVGTAFFNGSTDDDFGVVRFNPDGTLDPGFGTGGVITTDFGGVGAGAAAPLDRANAVAIQPDGRIVVVGGTGGRSADLALARYNPDGSPDASFGSTGRAVGGIGGGGEGYAVVMQPDGQILVAGSGGSTGSGESFLVARFRGDGSLDTTFASSGFATAAFESGGSGARAMVLQPDDMVVLGGSGYGPAPTDVPNGGFALLRYRADGSPDASFGVGGRVLTTVGDAGASINGLGLQADGRIVAAGLVSFKVIVARSITGTFAGARHGRDWPR